MPNLESLRRIAAGTHHPSDLGQLDKAITALEHIQTLGHAHDSCPTCCRSNRDHIRLVVTHPAGECIPIEQHNRIVAQFNNRKGNR